MGLQIIEEKHKTKRQQYEESVRQACEQVPLSKIDPSLCAMGKERIERTLNLLMQHVQTGDAKIADLGCGVGTLAARLIEQGNEVCGVEVHELALDRCEQANIHCLNAALPYFKLPEQSFDGVIFTDVIAEIDTHLRRLLLSELSILLKKEGWFLCSTELDLYSYDSLMQFEALMQTEFEIFFSKKSYHRLYFYTSRWLSAPSRLVRASQDSSYRMAQMMKRRGFFRLFFYLNSIKWMAYFWQPIAKILAPLKKRIQFSRGYLLFAERISKLIWGNRALTHIIVLARKKKI